MDLDSASKAHSEWKVKLRLAISNKEQLDAASIAQDNCCALGKWLHGDAKGLFSALPAYKDCVAKHAAFHREASKVALVINARNYDAATKMLDAGTAYAQTTTAVGSAILGLKKAAAIA
jgi:methyl-accepting chemotaxis protein